jgi:spore coat polysaccharide biosynthesis protein SpsF
MTRDEQNIGALIPVRLASQRLPGKALKELCGKPVIHHLLDRVFACRYISPERAVVCTTEQPSDDPLVAAVEDYGASVFRGASDDIIDRFHAATRRFGFDAVVQIDGDDPLSATEYMDLTMEQLLADPMLDIVTCTGLPLGTAVKSFTAAAMDRVHDRYGTAENDTGFIYFFTKTGLCRQAEIGPSGPEHVFDGARLTLDYEEDLALFTAIFDALYRPNKTFDLAEVVAFLRDHPEITGLNADLEEEYWQRTHDRAQLEFRDDAGKVHRIPV